MIRLSGGRPLRRMGAPLLCLAIALCLCAAGENGCDGCGVVPEPGPSNNDSNNSASPGPGSVRIRVTGPEGQPLVGVSATLSGQTLQTGSDGSALFRYLAATSGALLALRHDGYVRNVKAVDVIADQEVAVDLAMAPVGVTQTIDASEQSSVRHREGGVTIPANSLADAEGKLVRVAEATVTVALPSDERYTDVFPGEFVGTRENGGSVGLESFGIVDVDLRDEAGNRLQLAQGKTADVIIPIDPAHDPGTPTVPLWYLDEATGKWVEQGQLTRDDTAKVYRGTVSHFSTWNCDQWWNRSWKHVKVVDALDQPVAGAAVTITGEGWSSRGWTGADGLATVACRPLSSMEVMVQRGTDVVGPYTEISPAAGETLENTVALGLVPPCTPGGYPYAAEPGPTDPVKTALFLLDNSYFRVSSTQQIVSLDQGILLCPMEINRDSVYAGGLEFTLSKYSKGLKDYDTRVTAYEEVWREALLQTSTVPEGEAMESVVGACELLTGIPMLVLDLGDGSSQLVVNPQFWRLMDATATDGAKLSTFIATYLSSNGMTGALGWHVQGVRQLVAAGKTASSWAKRFAQFWTDAAPVLDAAGLLLALANGMVYLSADALGTLVLAHWGLALAEARYEVARDFCSACGRTDPAIREGLDRAWARIERDRTKNLPQLFADQMSKRSTGYIITGAELLAGVLKVAPAALQGLGWTANAIYPLVAKGGLLYAANWALPLSAFLVAWTVLDADCNQAHASMVEAVCALTLVHEVFGSVRPANVYQSERMFQGAGMRIHLARMHADADARIYERSWFRTYLADAVYLGNQDHQWLKNRISTMKYARDSVFTPVLRGTYSPRVISTGLAVDVRDGLSCPRTVGAR